MELNMNQKIVVNSEEYAYNLYLTESALNRFCEIKGCSIVDIQLKNGHHNIDRTDTALLQLVQEMDGFCCDLGKLKVVELPSGVDWGIKKYGNVYQRYFEWFWNESTQQFEKKLDSENTL